LSKRNKTYSSEIPWGESMPNEVEEFNDDNPRHGPAISSCPEQGCSTEYRKLLSLETQMCISNHVYINKENSIDKVKHLWDKKCMSVVKNFKVLVRSTSERAVNQGSLWTKILCCNLAHACAYTLYLIILNYS
jgi:hypothetical protein